MNKVIFLSYDGILEPLGYSQILSYLLPLSKKNKIFIVSFEKENDLKNKLHYLKIKTLLKKNDINWKYVKYNKNFFKYLKIISIFFYLIYLIKSNKINIIHSRSYISGFLAYSIKKFFKIKYIFDMRGFWLEERIEWKIWTKKSFKYIFFKYFEKKIIFKSDSIVTLTSVAIELIRRKYNLKNSNIIFESIPTCVNIINNNYNFKIKNKSNIVLAHLGAIGTRYEFKKYLKIGKKLRSITKVYFSIFNKGEHSSILNELKNFDIEEDDYQLKYVLPYDITKNLNNVNIGVFFPVSGFYLNGYFPTKLGEFLSSGIPVITAKINKDVDSIITENKIGLVIDDVDNFLLDDLNKKLIDDLLTEETAIRCKKIAERYFDINSAVNKYNKIYNQI